MCLFALPGTTTKSKQTNTIALFIGLFASDCLYGTQARMRGWHSPGPIGPGHTPAGTPAYPGRYPGIPRPLAPTLYPLALALALPLALALALGLPTWAEQEQEDEQQEQEQEEQSRSRRTSSRTSSRSRSRRTSSRRSNKTCRTGRPAGTESDLKNIRSKTFRVGGPKKKSWKGPGVVGGT